MNEENNLILGEGFPSQSGRTFAKLYKGTKHKGEEPFPVAVRVIESPGLAEPDLILRAKRLSELNDGCPQLIHYLRPIKTSGRLQIPLEYCKASMTLIGHQTSLNENQLSFICSDVLSALSYLKSKNIVHGLVQPDNLFLCEDGRVKLDYSGDLFLEKSEDTIYVGKVKYAAPEIILGESVPSEATDIWSLGILCIHLLKKNTTETSGMHSMMDRLMLAPKLKNPHLFSWAFTDFIEKCTAHYPSKRSSFQDLLQHPFVKDIVVDREGTMLPLLKFTDETSPNVTHLGHSTQETVRAQDDPQTWQSVSERFILKNGVGYVRKAKVSGRRRTRLSGPKMSEPSGVSVEDFTRFPDLTESQMVNILRDRLANDDIYTSIGYRTIIAMNPMRTTNEVSSPSTMSKSHIFGLVERAHRRMLLEGKSQTIVMRGLSGSGKTENTSYALDYILHKIQNIDIQGGEVMNKLRASSELLRAFGNAKTVPNHNSSRYAVYYRIMCNAAGNVTGASIFQNLLERSRTTTHVYNELNFHFFYYLTHSSEFSEREEISLLPPDAYRYLRTPTPADASKYSREMEKVLQCMKTLQMNEEMILFVCKVCSAALLLGNVQFGESSEVVQQVASLLGIDEKSLHKVLTKRSLSTNAKDESFYNVPYSLKESESLRDSISRSLYGSLFEWMTNYCNDLLSSTPNERNLGFLDVFGHENSTRNGVEQFCINYAAEKLQKAYDENNFFRTDRMCKEEGLTCPNYSGPSTNHETPVDLYEGENYGMIGILQQMTWKADVRETQLIQRIESSNENHPNFIRSNDRQRFAFAIRHTSCDVEYSGNFLTSNREYIPTEFFGILSESSNPLVRSIYNDDATPDQQKSTMTSKYESTLDQLTSSVLNRGCHYVLCVNPSEKKTPGDFDAEYVTRQLRCMNVLKTTFYKCHSFPFSFTHADFIKRYYALSGKRNPFEIGQSIGQREAESLCRSLETNDTLQTQDFHVGPHLVLLKEGQYDAIEEIRHGKTLVKAKVIIGAISRYFAVKKTRQALGSISSPSDFDRMMKSAEIRAESLEDLHEKLEDHATPDVIDEEWMAIVAESNRRLAARALYSEPQAQDNLPALSKNRYVDIRPYTSTRVLLQRSVGDVNSDYINASFVDIGPMHFIACQAPLPHTVEDFYRMIIQFNTSSVVMLTRFVEGGKVSENSLKSHSPIQLKADQYFPDLPNSSQTYGSIRVQVTEIKEAKQLTVRTMDITDLKNDVVHRVEHHQYSGWPDHGVPKDIMALMSLSPLLNDTNKSSDGPITVHCSAGIGRTGAYIILTNMCKMILDYKQSLERGEQPTLRLNMVDTLVKLRDQRSGMLTHRDQYAFCYQTIASFAKQISSGESWHVTSGPNTESSLEDSDTEVTNYSTLSDNEEWNNASTNSSPCASPRLSKSTMDVSIRPSSTEPPKSKRLSTGTPGKYKLSDHQRASSQPFDVGIAPIPIEGGPLPEKKSLRMLKPLPLRKWTIKSDNLGFRYQSGQYGMPRPKSIEMSTSPIGSPMIGTGSPGTDKSPSMEEEPREKTKSLGKSHNHLFRGKMSLKGFSRAATFDGLSLRPRNAIKQHSIFYEEPHVDISEEDTARLKTFFSDEGIDLRNRLIKDFFLREMEYFKQLQILSVKMRELEPTLLREGLSHTILNFGEVYVQSATIIKNLYPVFVSYMVGGTTILNIGHVLLQLADSFKYHVRYCLDIDSVIGVTRTPKAGEHTSKIGLSELAGMSEGSPRGLKPGEELMLLPKVHLCTYSKRLREIQNETGRLSVEHVDIEQVTQLIEQVMFRIQTVPPQ
ncbi:myosin-Vb-like [Planoprotostelium fungivorum]|uniref:Myosin-Vb-like n=1 Tax=Planoprotostelium fungivorum TaxID=1890364 RepID=A0A2P6NE48_9EUKA|nr:myosin-Vb-like [Planoprotostelium fungivorum]